MDIKGRSPAWVRSQPWMQQLDAREQEQVAHAVVYAQDHAGAGIPGHGLHLLVAKLARLLDQYAPNYIAHSFKPEDHP